MRSFLMPDPAPSYRPTFFENAAELSYTFGWSAEFISLQESGGQCDCACCEYRQFVTSSFVSDDPHPLNPDESYGPREDCVCTGVRTRFTGAGVTQEMFQVRCDPASPPPDTDFINCAGEIERRDLRGVGHSTAYSSDGCSLKDTDTPTRFAKIGAYVTWTTQFVGSIWDVCYQVERSVRGVLVTLTGEVGPPKERQRFNWYRAR